MKHEIFYKSQLIVIKDDKSIPKIYNLFLHLDNLLRNPYFVCRAFWNEEPITSIVCWGSSSPKFNFEQVRYLIH